MNSFQIKVLAIVCMVMDHVGLFFFPKLLIMRLIGRVAFPLFAWFVANGARHTRNINAYFGRLLLLALVTQAPFWYANRLIGSPALYFNVVFTLCLGLIAIMVMQKVANRWLWLSAVVVCAAIATLFHSDYGAAGVLSVVAFYLFSNNFRGMALAQIFIMGVFPMLIFQLKFNGIINLSHFYLSSRWEYLGLLSLLVILVYNKERGIRDRYLFYIFYFLQYMTILGVKLAI